MFKNLYSHISKNLLTKFFLLCLKFGVTIFTSRILGADGRGLYILVNQIVGFTNSLFSISAGEGLIYYINKFNIFKKKVFFIIFFLILIFSLISIIILVFLNFYIENSENLNKLNLDLKIIILCLIIPFTTEYLVTSALRGFKLFDNLNKLSLISRANIFLFISFTFFFDDNKKIESCLLLYLIAYSINCIIYTIYLNNICIEKYFFKIRNVFDVLKYSLKAHLINLFNETEYRIDIFIIFFLINVKAVGIYSIAVAVSQLVFYVTNSINTIIFPYFSSNIKVAIKKKLLANMMLSSMLFSSIILLPIIMFGWFFFPLVFGAEFTESYQIFLILSLATIAESLSRIMVSWFKGLNKSKELISISAISLITNISLNIFLIPHFNLIGVAISSTISYWLRFILIYIKFRSHNNFKLKNTFFLSLNKLKLILYIAYKSIKKSNN